MRIPLTPPPNFVNYGILTGGGKGPHASSVGHVLLVRLGRQRGEFVLLLKQSEEELWLKLGKLRDIILRQDVRMYSLQVESLFDSFSQKVHY